MMLNWLRGLFKRGPKSAVVYPYRPLIEALKAKDADLYARHCNLSPASFAKVWREKYPEDFAS